MSLPNQFFFRRSQMNFIVHRIEVKNYGNILFYSFLSVQNIGNLSTCSTFKRLKTIGLGEMNLN